MAPLNSSTAELEKSLFSVRPHPQNNVRVGPTAPATFGFASVPRSRKAAQKKTSRTKSPKIFSAHIRRPSLQRTHQDNQVSAR